MPTSQPDRQELSVQRFRRSPTHSPRVKTDKNENVEERAEDEIEYRHKEHGSVQQVYVQQVLMRHKKHEVSYRCESEKKFLCEVEVQEIEGEAIEDWDDPDQHAAEYQHTHRVSGQVMRKAGRSQCEVSQSSSLQETE